MNVKLLSSWEMFHAAVEQIRCTEVLALDTETTGLDPRTNTIRLCTISDGVNTWVLDTQILTLIPLFPILQQKTLILHNAIFDLQFLAGLGFWPGKVFDTMLLSQIVYAGLREDNNKPVSHSLQAVAKRELGIELEKELQTSNWSGKLSQAQIDYAARDAHILIPIYKSLIAKADHFKLNTVVDIEHRALPGLLWMSVKGIPFNAEKWIEVAEKEFQRAEKLEEELQRWATISATE